MQTKSAGSQNVASASRHPSPENPRTRKRRADPESPYPANAAPTKRWLKSGADVDRPGTDTADDTVRDGGRQVDPADRTAGLPAEMMLAVLTALASSEGARHAIASRLVCRRWDELLSLVPAVRHARRRAGLRMYAHTALYLMDAGGSVPKIWPDDCNCHLLLLPRAARSITTLSIRKGEKIVIVSKERKYVWKKVQPELATCRCGEPARLDSWPTVGREFGRLFLSCNRPGTSSAPRCGYQTWLASVGALRRKPVLRRTGMERAEAVSRLARQLERRPSWVVELRPWNRWGMAGALDEMLGCAAGLPLLALLGATRFSHVRGVGLGRWLGKAGPSLPLSAPRDWTEALEDRAVFAAVGTVLRRLEEMARV